MKQSFCLEKQNPDAAINATKVTFDGGIIDFENGQIQHADSTRSRLRKGELRLLRYLYQHRGRVVSRDEMIREVWGLESKNILTRVVDVQVGVIRKKLRDSAHHAK